jgi:hypothetical protein
MAGTFTGLVRRSLSIYSWSRYSLLPGVVKLRTVLAGAAAMALATRPEPLMISKRALS